MKKNRVVIIGGGVAGLSAAHELVERDFEVTIYERGHVLGGKARSVAVPETHELRQERKRRNKDTNQPLPGEHGFRFFPGWYWHLPDTMKRIPYPKTGKSVFENLVPADVNLLASYGQDPIKAVVTFPVSWQQVKLVLKFPQEVLDLVPVYDLEFFARKMIGFLVSCEERRLAEYETQSWWDFMEAGRRSEPFRQLLVRAATRTTVAARPEHASAYTVCKMAVQTFVDSIKPLNSIDRVLNGPTNEVWIDPWRDFLVQQGVTIKTGWELDRIVWPESSDPTPKGEIKAVRFTRTKDDLKLAEARLRTFELIRVLRALPALPAIPSHEELATLAARAENVGQLQLSERLALLFFDEARRGPKLHQKLGIDLGVDGNPFASLADLLRGVPNTAAGLATVGTAATALERVVLDELVASDDQLARALQAAREVEARWPPAARVAAGIAAYFTAISTACTAYRSSHDRAAYARDVVAAEQTYRRAAGVAAATAPPDVWDEVRAVVAPLRRQHLDSSRAAFWDEKHDCPALGDLGRFFADPVLTFLRLSYQALREEDLKAEVVRADYFVFALPVEQMAYLVARSPTLLKHDAASGDRYAKEIGALANLVRLSEHVDWMAGIQFFLNEKVSITRGHVACLDSEWSLSAISQAQFWDDVDLKERGLGDCKGVLSVDISAWDRPGGDLQKPAWDCTKEEIAREVWSQLKRSLNRPGQPAVLTDDMLCGGPNLIPLRNFYLDDSIVDRYDRKKQGFFEKFRRVGFDTNALVDRRSKAARAVDVPEAFGPRLQINAEPLLVNRPGALFLRPQASTGVANMFIAADYVQTMTNLATMEGANEAARSAVNAILRASGSKREPCEVRYLLEPGEPLRVLDKELWERKQRFEDTYGDIPVRLAGAGMKAALGAAEKAWETARDVWKSFRRDS